MKRKHGILALICGGGVIAIAIFTECATTPQELNTYTSDIATLRGRFEENQSIDDLPASSFLADWEKPRIISEQEKLYTDNYRDLEWRVHQVEDEYFYRKVGTMESYSGNQVMGNFEGDVTALCWDMGFGIAFWAITDRKSTYHDAYYTPRGVYVPAWTDYFDKYEADFLVPIPRNDQNGKDAWMLGLNVRDMNYDDRAATNRNAGVIVTNVYNKKPAFYANVRPKHVVIAVNGKDIVTMEDWRRETANIQPGVPVKLTTVLWTGHFETYTETLNPLAIPPEEERTPPAGLTKPNVGLGTGMVKVDGGTFYMGSDGGDASEKPLHEVSVNTFYMCDHEVTQAEWQDIMGTNPSYCVIDSRFDPKYQPVERVTWSEAIDYCNRRSDAEGLTRAYYKNDQGLTCNFYANGYRLPTEAEWEFAARGGAKGRDKKFAGGNGISDVAWYTGTGGFPQQVMQKNANRLGIYDLTGNVGELCWDRYNTEYYSNSPKENPQGASLASISRARTVRGASAFDNEASSLLYKRTYITEKGRGRKVGLRVVRSNMNE